jgi:hypothetical protein
MNVRPDAACTGSSMLTVSAMPIYATTVVPQASATMPFDVAS